MRSQTGKACVYQAELVLHFRLLDCSQAQDHIDESIYVPHP